MERSFNRWLVARTSELWATRCNRCGALACSRNPRILEIVEGAHVCLGLSRGSAFRRKPMQGENAAPLRKVAGGG